MEKKDVNVNIRIISSTSRNLLQEVDTGKFREDLFHRLNVVPIELGPLTSRTEDIPELIDYFKKKISEINGVQEIEINTKNDLLYTYSWPGNVRELRNLIERISIISANESKENVDQTISDILNNKGTNDNYSTFKDTFTSPLKEAREQFEKNISQYNSKKIMEIYLKQLILLVWSDLLFIES